MYGQNERNDNSDVNTSQNNATSEEKSDMQENTASQSSYTYVFSSGGYSRPAQEASASPVAEKNGNRGFSLGVLILTVFLCAAVSFAAGFGGTQLALVLAKGQGNIPANPVIDSPSEDSLHNDDPESLLSQGVSEPSIYGSAGDEVFSVSQVVQKVEKSVVVIDVKLQSFGSASTSSGSGVIISSEGYILTCNHVVENAKEITVTLTSGNTYSAAFVGGDAQSDLAVLKIAPQEALTYAEHGKSENLVAGETVVAIGNPLGVLGGTVTRGIISSTERNITMSDGTVMKLLQTDAAINSGNSGGGLFNLDGQLIGIVNAKYASNEGLAFAIPIDSALPVEKDLIRYGYVRGVADHGLETVYISQMDLILYNEHYFGGFGITEPGVYVNSSEFCKDLQTADRILSVNGVEITSVDHLEGLIRQYKVGDTLTVVASRKGVQFTVSLTLQEYVPDHVKNNLK